MFNNKFVDESQKKTKKGRVVEHLSPKAGLQNASSGLQLTDSLLFG
jgi:hypothetical protein